MRYLFVPRVRLPSLYLVQRAAAVTTTTTTTTAATIAAVDPLIPFRARRERGAVIFRGLFRAFLWRVLSTGLGLGWYMKESAREIFSSPSLSYSFSPPLSLSLSRLLFLFLSPSLTDSVLEYSPVFLLTFAFSSHERTDSDSFGF